MATFVLMLPSDIQGASDQELRSAMLDGEHDKLKPLIREEVERRVASQIRERIPSTAFNPNTDISADTRYLWKRLFIWFWAIPATAGLIWLAFVNLK